MQSNNSFRLAAATTLLAACGLVSAQIPVVTMFPVTTQTSFPSPQCTGTSSTESFTVNYNFESVERGDPIIATTEIAEYNLLNFKSINFVDTDTDFDGNHLGLAPHTYPYVATFSPGTEIIDDLLSPNISMITASYIESTLTSFTPKSFWYGCVYPFPYTAGSLPVDCNITATGFDKSGNLVAKQSFEFSGNGSIIQDQNYGTFQGFSQVYSVAFGVSPIIAAALVDNIIATLYQEECAPYYTGSYGNGTSSSWIYTSGLSGHARYPSLLHSITTFQTPT
ncbi:uncharacterized protein LY89DRAFT_724016 [Mollisia scopiformis]|uniref:Uncharacterized protein n=1 Tax=Mollisia scopiformis TaxID=149040 RepID=A0A132BC35_MOLSC|nr:uncharacterized protein LY89DRAFT_724016 [Mollisia scopiformis]KUJ09569.1 hypothetical protein LY89DRAFT_724016 [Mollisia scopiformis]